MPASKEVIDRFLSHPTITYAWGAGQIYGEVNDDNTSKLRKKHLGIEKRRLTAEELEKIDQIRRKYIDEII